MNDKYATKQIPPIIGEGGVIGAENIPVIFGCMPVPGVNELMPDNTGSTRLVVGSVALNGEGIVTYEQGDAVLG